MRGNILEFMRVVAGAVELPEPVVGIGAYQVLDAPYPSDLRRFFPGKRFIGCDARPGTGVDRIEDVHQLSFGDETAGCVILLETLEHVADPLRAMAEVFRVLRPGGFVIASSCMDTPVHEHPADYWRFTPGGFDLVLGSFHPRRVFLQGHPQFPHSVVGVGSKGGKDEALAPLDTLVPGIPGTLTQEISPRLAPDPFRPLGTELTPAEEKLYPERMLHVAFDRILARDEELQRLRTEVETLSQRLAAVQQPEPGPARWIASLLSRRSKRSYT